MATADQLGTPSRDGYTPWPNHSQFGNMYRSRPPFPSPPDERYPLGSPPQLYSQTSFPTRFTGSSPSYVPSFSQYATARSYKGQQLSFAGMGNSIGNSIGNSLHHTVSSRSALNASSTTIATKSSYPSPPSSPPATPGRRVTTPTLSAVAQDKSMSDASHQKNVTEEVPPAPSSPTASLSAHLENQAPSPPMPPGVPAEVLLANPPDIPAEVLKDLPPKKPPSPVKFPASLSRDLSRSTPLNPPNLSSP